MAKLVPVAKKVTAEAPVGSKKAVPKLVIAAAPAAFVLSPLAILF